MSGYAGASARAGHGAIGKGGFHLWAKEIEQQGTGDQKADSAAPEVTPNAINQIAQNLSGDDGRSQSPSPKSAAEPAGPGERQCCAEKHEENPDGSATRRELRVCGGVERPDSIQSRAGP
jgi:hypothetical protein